MNEVIQYRASNERQSGAGREFTRAAYPTRTVGAEWAARESRARIFAAREPLADGSAHAAIFLKRLAGGIFPRSIADG